MVVPRVTFLQKKAIGLRLRTWLLLFVLAPFALWGILNLVFSTGWGTGFLERRIEARIGLPCEIESVSWSPWAGVKVGDIELHTAGKLSSESVLLQVDGLQVDPSWRSLTQGEIRWERLEVGEMSGRVSVEQLKEILAKYHEKHPVTVLSSPTKSPSSALNETGNEVTEPPGKSGPKPAPKVVTPVAPAKVNEEKVKAPQEVPVDGFEGIVIVKNVNLELYSEKNPELSIRLREVAGEIPIWGESREGELRVGGIELGSRLAEKSLSFPVKWDDGSLRLNKTGMKLFGVDLNIKGAIRLVSGLPTGLQIDLPDQQMDLTSIYMNEKPPLEVAHLSSRNTFNGQLLHPRSFKGQSVTRFRDLILHDPKDGGDTRFDYGSAVLKFTSSGLIAKDVRAIGEEDSILMNGFVTTGGAAAATVRIVSSPERASSHEKRVRSSSQALEFAFRPLVTPDREYRDVRIEARSGTLMMDLGIGEQWVALVPSVSAILGKPNQLKPPRLP